MVALGVLELVVVLALGASCLAPPRRYLVIYRGAQGSFRGPEFDAAAAGGVSGARLVPADPGMGSDVAAHCGGDVGPPLFMEAVGAEDESELAAVASRSVLIRAVLELWGSGETHEAAAAAATEGLRPLAEGASWRVCAMRVGAARGKTGGSSLRTCSDPDVLSALAPCLRAAVSGPVDLGESAAETLVAAFDYDRAVDDSDSRRPAPRRVYVGRLVARGDRETRAKYALRSRPVVGTTTMDPETAALMARLARLGRGDAVLDPFAGTCGCLLAAAELTRAPTTAADVDAKVLDASRVNFDAYDLPRPVAYPGISAADLPRHLDERTTFDAIITDPPYGKRERVGGGDVAWLRDLLALASDRLAVGGRLVFFAPHSSDATPEDVAAQIASQAPTYDLDATATQRLSGPWRRTLLVLVRTDRTAATPRVALRAKDAAYAGLARYWRGLAATKRATRQAAPPRTRPSSRPPA